MRSVETHRWHDDIKFQFNPEHITYRSFIYRPARTSCPVASKERHVAAPAGRSLGGRLPGSRRRLLRTPRTATAGERGRPACLCHVDDRGTGILQETFDLTHHTEIRTRIKKSNAYLH